MNKSNPEEITQQENIENTSGQHSGELQVSISQIGRYRIERLIGKGGFGSVYLAHDEELDRFAAVKIPHFRLIRRKDNAESYSREARTVANLDHPNIVSFHDIGGTPEVPCYVVSKYVKWTDLATRLMSSDYDYREAAELVATVASDLHYAHKKGWRTACQTGKHPARARRHALHCRFCLALREEDIGKGPRHAGTAAYMSPEQARGEGTASMAGPMLSASAWCCTRC